MIRAIIIGGAAGAAIGLVGYDLELILHSEATVWNYVLFGCGAAGLIALWLFIKHLKRCDERTDAAAVPTDTMGSPPLD